MPALSLHNVHGYIMSHYLKWQLHRFAFLIKTTASLAQWLRRPPRKQKIPRSNPAWAGIFSGVESYQWLQSFGTPVVTLPGARRQCWDWLAWCQYTVTGWDGKVWSATSISVWQHVKLSEQFRPWDTLACCWDIKQPTNKLIKTVCFATSPSPPSLPITLLYPHSPFPPSPQPTPLKKVITYLQLGHFLVQNVRLVSHASLQLWGFFGKGGERGVALVQLGGELP